MKRVFLVLLLNGLFVGSLVGGTREEGGFIPILNDTALSDTGNFPIWQDNMGRFFRGTAMISGRRYLNGFGGLWVGVLDPLRTRSDTAVSWSYDPYSGQSEFCPTTPDGDASRYLDSLARIYKSSIPRDTAQWPERDSSGRAIISSDQELWTIDNDLGPFMVNPDSAIGVQVIRRTFAWHSTSLWGDIVKVEFDVKNVTGRWGGNPHILPKVILGISLDANLGSDSESNSNDLCFPARVSGSPFPNLVVQYQLVQESGWSIPPPYFVGYRFFVETPKATDTVRVRDRQYPRTILPGEPLGTTAIKIYDLPDPQTAFEKYLFLQGMFSLSDTNNAYGGMRGPGVQNILACCGPFSLPNDSTVRLSFHMFPALDSLQLWQLAELLGVEAPPERVLPKVSTIALYSVSPHPSAGPCLIRYALPGPSRVSLKVYDISGRLVRELDRGERPAGVHVIGWDGRNGAGLSVPGGVYLYRLEAGGYTRTRSVVLLR
jgi:hypothetical protein